MQLVPVTSTPEILTANFDGHPFRVTSIDGRPWLVGIDLSTALGVKVRAMQTVKRPVLETPGASERLS